MALALLVTVGGVGLAVPAALGRDGRSGGWGGGPGQQGGNRWQGGGPAQQGGRGWDGNNGNGGGWGGGPGRGNGGQSPPNGFGRSHGSGRHGSGFGSSGPSGRPGNGVPAGQVTPAAPGNGPPGARAYGHGHGHGFGSHGSGPHGPPHIGHGRGQRQRPSRTGVAASAPSPSSSSPTPPSQSTTPPTPTTSATPTPGSTPVSSPLSTATSKPTTTTTASHTTPAAGEHSVTLPLPTSSSGGAASPLSLITSAVTGPLSTANGQAGGATGRTGAITGALAPGTAAIGTRSAVSGRTIGSAHRHTHLTIKPIGPLLGTATTVIDHIINVIPIGVWIALAAALGLAGLAGTAALRSGRRIRLQAGEVAAVTAAALTDPLTGVLNRRGFIESAERELDRARRYSHPLALAFVDIRGLKAVNDTEGHLAGDKLLKRVTALLRESARTHDLVGRIGGDELAVVLAEQSAGGAAAMTQRVRAQVPAYRAALGLVTAWDVTIGTATYPEDGDGLDDLLAAADRRLYQQRGIDLAR